MTNKKTSQTEENQQETLNAEADAAAEEATETTEAKAEAKQPAMTLEEQVLDLEDRNLRLLAEMQNMRARHQKDMKDTREYAVSGFANDMIALSENIYRAREAIPNAEDELYSKLLSGIDLTIEELKRVFTKHGIERIAPNSGDKFDYNMHQALAQVPTNEVEDGCVVSLIHAGYRLKERILKPAMVAVAKKVEEKSDQQ